ncbi:lipopolysaccharide assembly LapA domain-containing protein [Paenibacillus sp. A3M_27_13]|uniref:LapA family protein n=1 Tax=unclassified Paenibacillus TaxID=185978 RepID=UPI0020B64AFA|nr:lipopolysaccharide assembly protein LapA domain-containing protein [Paenibacillus sp. A3M_27_13]MCP3744834.1 lipopolysaccharide assembly protein LapA domain-containing protein [Paenibacillus sp. A3M_27_13]
MAGKGFYNVTGGGGILKTQWSLIAALVIALLTAVFAVINVNSVQVNFLFSMVSIPLILLILGCTLLGGLIVGSFGIFRQYRLQREIKRLTTQLHTLQEEHTSTVEANADVTYDTTGSSSTGSTFDQDIEQPSSNPDRLSK